MPIDKICAKCGNGFRVPPSHDRIKFCSQRCYWDTMRGCPSRRKNFHHTIETIERIRKIKRSQPVNPKSIEAISGWWKGKKRGIMSDERRLTLRLTSKGKHYSPITEFKKYHIPLAGFRKGSIPWNKGLTKETDSRIAQYAQKDSIAKRLKGYAPTLEARAKGFRVAMGVRPTKPEKKFMDICQIYQLPFKYTGKGDIWIGRRNPDFIDYTGRKVVVEIFGSYWHKPGDADIRRKEYAEYGFECITFQENTLKDLNRVIEELTKHGYILNLNIQIIRAQEA